MELRVSYVRLKTVKPSQQVIVIFRWKEDIDFHESAEILTGEKSTDSREHKVRDARSTVDINRAN